ncbi:hypothetical protein AB0M43_14495 [Longispora sp. NPDC051575]|uniref:hypothetical protein n=1 Tax=Longispora sp. NPDC051575 TaxID=3154943 RepID=UPI00342287CE
MPPTTTPGPHAPDSADRALLARLAAPVLATHQPDLHHPDRCVSPLCRHEYYPCGAARAARRAQHLAAEPAAAAPATEPVTVIVPVVAVGRASVPPAPPVVESGFWAPHMPEDESSRWGWSDRYFGRHRPLRLFARLRLSPAAGRPLRSAAA